MSSVKTKAPPNSDRRSAIVEAARAVFTRHGYRKASMQDIADSARISRPTLYASFPDKGAVFTALVEVVSRENAATCADRLRVEDDVVRRARLVLEVWIVDPYVALVNLGGADDIVAIAGEVAPDAMKDFWDLCLIQLYEALAPLARRLGSTIRSELGFTLMSAGRDAKTHAHTEIELRAAIDKILHVLTFLAAASARSAEKPR